MASNYCKAYHVRDFRRFSRWPEQTAVPSTASADGGSNSRQEDDVLYLHAGFVVTDGYLPSDPIVFQDDGQDWKSFCADELGFSIPEYAVDDATGPSQERASQT